MLLSQCIWLLMASVVLGEPQFPSLQPNVYGPPAGPTTIKPPVLYRPQQEGAFHDQQEPAHYDFSYEIRDDYSGNSFGHSENREGDVTSGRYFVLLPDGRTQVVAYSADHTGYHPFISYEGEPGYPSAPPPRPAAPSNPHAHVPGSAIFGPRATLLERQHPFLTDPDEYEANAQPTTFRPALQTYVSSSRPLQSTT